MNASLCYLTSGKGEGYVHQSSGATSQLQFSVLYGGTWEGEAPLRSAPLRRVAGRPPPPAACEEGARLGRTASCTEQTERWHEGTNTQPKTGNSTVTIKRRAIYYFRSGRRKKKKNSFGWLGCFVGFFFYSSRSCRR